MLVLDEKVWSIHKFWCIDMPDVTANYGMHLDFIQFFLYINDDHSCLNYCISTKNSLIMCLSYTHILIYRHARCDCRLWKVIWFFWIFIHNWRALMSNFHRLCVWYMYTFWYIDMTDVTANYDRLSDLNAFVWKFLYIITCLIHYNFIKLSQIAY